MALRLPVLFGDPAGEGYVLTVDDRMFWERTYASMAGGPPDEP